VRQAERQRREQFQREQELIQEAMHDYQLIQAKEARKRLEELQPPTTPPPLPPIGITADLADFEYEAIVAGHFFWVPFAEQVDLPPVSDSNLCRLTLIGEPVDNAHKDRPAKPAFTVTENCDDAPQTTHVVVGAKAKSLPSRSGTIAIRRRARAAYTLGRLAFEIDPRWLFKGRDMSDKNLESSLFKSNDVQVVISTIPEGYPAYEIENTFKASYDSEDCQLLIGDRMLGCTRAIDGSERIELYIFRNQSNLVAVRVTYQDEQYDNVMHQLMPTLASLQP
jgi:hypothetical protein